jgi:hypothetical protein
MSDRLTGCLVSPLARVSARKRAYTQPETSAETSTQRSAEGRWIPCRPSNIATA